MSCFIEASVVLCDSLDERYVMELVKLMQHLLNIILCGTVMGLLAACTPNVATRGMMVDPDKLAEIKVSTTTREQVATTLGSPTQLSTFDDKTWYYIGRQTKQYSFLDPQVTQQKAVAVHFDDQGIVTSINDLDLAGATDISPVDRQTPTYGNDNTLVQQLLGSLAHPGLAKAKRQGQ